MQQNDEKEVPSLYQSQESPVESPAPKCTATKTNGDPCQSYAMSNGKFCNIHDHGSEIQTAGHAVMRRKREASLKWQEYTPIQSNSDVTNALEQVFNMLKLGTVKRAEANTMGVLLGYSLQAIKARKEEIGNMSNIGFLLKEKSVQIQMTEEQMDAFLQNPNLQVEILKQAERDGRIKELPAPKGRKAIDVDAKVLEKSPKIKMDTDALSEATQEWVDPLSKREIKDIFGAYLGDDRDPGTLEPTGMAFDHIYDKGYKGLPDECRPEDKHQWKSELRPGEKEGERIVVFICQQCGDVKNTPRTRKHCPGWKEDLK